MKQIIKRRRKPQYHNYPTEIDDEIIKIKSFIALNQQQQPQQPSQNLSVGGERVAADGARSARKPTGIGSNKNLSNSGSSLWPTLHSKSRNNLNQSYSV